MFLFQFFDIILDVFRIGSNDRAVVMVVGIRCFVAFIRNTRIPDKFNIIFNQPFDMSVCEFSRITFGFTRNGFDTKLVNLSG